MAKRGASSELTDRNWDQEDEPEEAGTFEKATEDALKGRQIIKAKRRTADEASGGKSAFSGFGGFAFKPTQTSTPLFSGGMFKTESKISEAEKQKDKLGTVHETTESAEEKSANGNHNRASDSPNRTAYLSNLKSLNMSVLNWIQTHLDKNPYCILTPIFKDYDTHLKQLEQDREKSESNGSSSKVLKKEESVKPMEAEKTEMPKTGLTFGMGTLQANSSTFSGAGFPAFSFKPTSQPLGTASGSGFSFAVGSQQNASGSKDDGAKGDDEDGYVPPVVETVEHKEEGSLYSKKCKLFYQKDGEWKDRGVGFLHLKKTDGKAQLLVRADTTLGNILLNIRLVDTTPMSRQGKNNVNLMCVVSPPIPKMPEDKPIPMLIRVKTGDDADELLHKMKEISS
ncbi:nuclear pore complex protein Nup50-like isoform X2 [Mya arenaria]|nr:nuclear pore complex protein Nup50-like isoform X2 [Mya arenaria]